MKEDIRPVFLSRVFKLCHIYRKVLYISLRALFSALESAGIMSKA